MTWAHQESGHEHSCYWPSCWIILFQHQKGSNRTRFIAMCMVIDILHDCLCLYMIQSKTFTVVEYIKLYQAIKEIIILWHFSSCSLRWCLCIVMQHVMPPDLSSLQPLEAVDNTDTLALHYQLQCVLSGLGKSMFCMISGILHVAKYLKMKSFKTCLLSKVL